MQCSKFLILHIPIHTEGLFLVLWAGKEAFSCLACFYSGRDVVVFTWRVAFRFPTHACEYHSNCRLKSFTTG